MKGDIFIKKMTRKEKILLGVSIVGACAAGYFGYKYISNNNKIKLLEKNLELTTNELDIVFQDNKDNCEKLNFLEFLVIESECIPKAKQNGNNKLAREESKIKGIIDAMVKRPDDKTLKDSLQKHEAEAKAIRYQLTNIDKLEDLINNDECIYAK